MSSALCVVTKGRAAAPPASGCIMGVSTSMNPRDSMKRRTRLTMRLRAWKVAMVLGVAHMST